MTTETDTPDDDVDPMEDAEAWQSLSRDEQDELLAPGLDDLRGKHGSGAWRHLTEGEQQATRNAIERRDLSPTEQAMADALDDTWTAELWVHDDEITTVPFECRELSDEEQSVLMEALRLVGQLEAQVGALDDADADDLDVGGFDSEHFNDADDLNEFITWLLASVTVDEAFDEERFRTGRGLRSNTRSLLFTEIALRYREEQQNALKFRTE